jgi:hypothetical protein
VSFKVRPLPRVVRRDRNDETRAIRRIAETFERDHQRKALVVIATGAGKTRTVIALCDLLMRCNWVKRVLFLADRIALVNQPVYRCRAVRLAPHLAEYRDCSMARAIRAMRALDLAAFLIHFFSLPSSFRLKRNEE